MTIAVEFTIRRSDLNRLFRLAEERKPSENKQWLVFVTAEGYVASFQVGPQYGKYPVRTISAGSAQFPLSSIKEVTANKKAKEIEIKVGDAFIACDGSSVESEDIKVGIRLDANYLVYPTRLELIVIGRTMQKATIEKLGLQARFERANSSLTWCISKAFSVLEPYGVEFADVEKFVDNAIQRNEPAVCEKFGVVRRSESE